jgi:hypothetical protein
MTQIREAGWSRQAGVGVHRQAAGRLHVEVALREVTPGCNSHRWAHCERLVPLPVVARRRPAESRSVLVLRSYGRRG